MGFMIMNTGVSSNLLLDALDLFKARLRLPEATSRKGGDWGCLKIRRSDDLGLKR